MPLSVQADVQHGSGLQDRSVPNQSIAGTVLTLQAAWTLWPPAWAQSRSLDAEQARLDLAKAQLALDNAVQQARQEGESLYDQARLDLARLQVAQRRLELAQRSLERATRQREAGLASEEAVLQARLSAQKAALAVQQAAAALSGVERQLGVSARQLEPLPEGEDLVALARRTADQVLEALAASAREVGLPAPVQRPNEGEGAAVLTEVPPLPETVLERVVSLAPEVAQARDQLALARRRLEAARRSRGTVSLSADASSVWATDRAGGPSRDLSVSLTASLDLLDGGSRRLDVEQAASAAADAERAVRDAEESVRQEARARWDDVATAALQLASARAELDLAQLKLAGAQGRYGRGVASQDEVASAELDRADAALALLDAAQALQRAWAQLLQRLQAAPAAGAGPAGGSG